MSSEWSVNTNKRLHFARLQLEAWESAGAMEANAFREGFVLQLQLALRSLLAEILVTYGIQVQQAPTFSQAKALVRDSEQSSSEFSQLEAMLEQGWLNQLEQNWEAMFVPFQADTNKPSHDLIQMVSLEGEVDPNTCLSVEAAVDSLNRFKDLVGHFRNLNFEW